MNSIQPQVTHQSSLLSTSTRQKLGRAAAYSAIPLLVANVLQWWHSSAEIRKLDAEREKTTTESQRMKQDAAEGESRAGFLWLDQLRKSPTLEQQISVLELAIATTPYESVKRWARAELAKREPSRGPLATRRSPELFFSAAAYGVNAGANVGRVD